MFRKNFLPPCSGYHCHTTFGLSTFKLGGPEYLSRCRDLLQNGQSGVRAPERTEIFRTRPDRH